MSVEAGLVVMMADEKPPPTRQQLANYMDWQARIRKLLDDPNKGRKNLAQQTHYSTLVAQYDRMFDMSKPPRDNS